MTASIERLLIDNGPMLASDLVKILTEGGLSEGAARQRVSRANGSVLRLQGLRFPNKQKFLFLDEHRDTEAFFEALSSALLGNGSAYGRALRGILARGGVIREEFSAIATGLPVNLAKKNLLHEDVVSQLRNLRMVTSYRASSGEFLSLRSNDLNFGRRIAAETVEQVVLSATREWLVRMNFGSSGTLKIRQHGESLPQCGQFAFDLVGPSYLSAIRGTAGGSLPGFVVGDIVLDRTLTVADVQPFLRKIDTLNSQKRSNKIQPLFIADSYDEEALKELRARGVILAGPTAVFGPELGRLIKNLIGSVENAAAALKNDSSSIFDGLIRLQKVEGAALNLRGLFLEMLIAHLYLRSGYMIDIRQQVAGNEKLAEIDVKASRSEEVVCIECKGMAAGNLVDTDEIDEWLNGPLIAIKEWLKHRESMPDSKRFEFYSSTGYTTAALALIEQIEAKHRKQPIRFYSGKDVVKKLTDVKAKKLAEVYREQFLS